MKTFFYFVALIVTTAAIEFLFHNNCSFTVWPGIQGNSGKSNPLNGGFVLASNQVISVSVDDNWAGNIWGRTDCDYGTSHCLTGDCGNRIECNGAGGAPPITLVEITLKAIQGLDIYDISLVYGFNLPVRITPVSGISNGTDHYCVSAGCLNDINAICPEDFTIKSGERTVACESACVKFNTDEYCCRNAYDSPENCKSSDWPYNFTGIFEQACPDAYSYVYDDTDNSFTCQGTNYEIVFCPNIY